MLRSRTVPRPGGLGDGFVGRGLRRMLFVTQTLESSTVCRTIRLVDSRPSPRSSHHENAAPLLSSAKFVRSCWARRCVSHDPLSLAYVQIRPKHRLSTMQTHFGYG